MTIVDFIELSDDNVIDLSSDEDTVQENQIATQDRATMLDKRGMFVLAGVGSQDLQAVFVAASEGGQDVQATFGAATEGTQEAAESGHASEATTSSLVMEKAPFVAASEGRQDMQAVIVAAREGRQDAAASGNSLEAIPLSFITEKTPLDTAESLNCCPRSPTTTLFQRPTSTTAKAQTSEGGDAESVRVRAKYRKKNYHTDTPRRSPRLMQMGECCTSPVKEPTADHKRSRALGPADDKRSRALGPADESAASTDKAGPAKTLSTEIAN